MRNLFILFLILVLIIIYTSLENKMQNDKFMVYWSGEGVYPLPNIPNNSNYPNYPNYPFLNSRIGQTTNMSYDLRGDPIIIPKYPFMQNYSTITPINNNKLC